MIARIQKIREGFAIFIPDEYAKAWELRQDFPLEVHRVDSTHEADEPNAIHATYEATCKVGEKILEKHAETFRELAKGPEGRGPHDED